MVLKCPNCGIGFNKKNLKVCLKCGNTLVSEDEYYKLHPDKKLVVECPYCHSTDTEKISNLSKVERIAVFGIFAVNKATKQWYCNNCKSDF